MDRSNHPDDGDNQENDGNADPEAATPVEEPDRIFRTPLCGMFQESRSSKTDACAVFCCGIYLSQRNQYLLVQEGFGDDARFSSSSSSSTTTATATATIIARRPLETAFVVLVLATFTIWLLDDPATHSLFSKIDFGAIAVLIFCVVWKLFEYQRARQESRRQLAIAEYHRRTRVENNGKGNDRGLDMFLEEHRREILGDGAHDLCGCARSETGCFGSYHRQSDSQEHENHAIVDDDVENHPPDFCSRAWQCLSNLCCGVLCGCHLQLCGMCAIAQESRHLGEVLPRTSRPRLWQRDYITMQPWTEYYPSILRLRLSNQIHCLPHFKALSRLSYQILMAAIAFLLFLALVFLLPIRFPKWQVLILYGTLLQPVVFLFFVHWLWNRLDLSFDAVIKYFACGFFICTSSALVYEWIVSKVAQKIIVLVDRLGSEGLLLLEDRSSQPSNGEWNFNSSHLERPLWYQLVIASFAAVINAFFVAGLTEEICKYLCFWMVEHPDLEFQDKVMIPSASVSRNTDKPAEKSDLEDTETTRLLSLDQPTSSNTEEQTIFAPTRPIVSIGEAITVAMITVALGFGCAENLLYIFVYTPPGFSTEIGTLYTRCLFPIHPLAAALQSIGVCRRDLENDSSVGIGRIILPAWLLHGFFDVSIMAYSAITEILDRYNSKPNYETASTNPPGIEPGEGESIEADQGVPFLVYEMGIPCIAMLYFLNESFYQRDRLEQIDKENRTQV